MRIPRRSFILLSPLVLLGCASKANKFQTYTGPEVTSLLLYKERHIMYLMNNDDVLKTYDFELGFAPVGHKQVEGDGRTPEGAYYITHRNPNSAYYLSLGISYPNERDRAVAREMGQSPGGDIFIHGTPKIVRREPDWTAGCIAITNREIEVVYAMVADGTPIFIYP